MAVRFLSSELNQNRISIETKLLHRIDTMTRLSFVNEAFTTTRHNDQAYCNERNMEFNFDQFTNVAEREAVSTVSSANRALAGLDKRSL